MYLIVFIYCYNIHPLTLMYFFSAFTIALRTTGSIADIYCLETLNRYIRDENESPVAKYRSVINNFMLGGTASLNLVFCFTISGSIIFNNEKKFVLDIHVKFPNRKSSSNCKSLIIPKFLVLK